MSALILGCGQQRATPLHVPSPMGAAPGSTAQAPSTPTAMVPFAFASARPERKAALLALVPKVDAYFQSKIEQLHATGAAVGIILDGELVYAKGFGVQNLTTRTPVDVDTVFRIASLTKSFTALAVMKLRDEGKLSLDEPVEHYLPELRSLRLPTRDSAPVTARLLLTHASGLAYDDQWGAVTFGQSDAELSRALTAGVSFSRAPGSEYAYSNLGYAILGRLVERIAHTPFRDYVRDHILRPLGMSATVWESGDVPAAHLADGYRWDGARTQWLPEPRTPDGAFAPAGGLYTSLRDYARYAAFNLMAYPARDDPDAMPVRRSTLREMHTGQRWARPRPPETPVVRRNADPRAPIALRAASYGLGWLNVTSCSEPTRLQHGGYEPGYFAGVILLPNERLGVVVLATSAPVAFRTYDGLFALLREAAVLRPPENPPPAPELVRSVSSIESLLERYDRTTVASTFDAQSLRYTWFENMERDFRELATHHGRCSTDGAITTHTSLHGTAHLNCERGSIDFDVLLTPAHPPKVQSLIIHDTFAPAATTERAAARLVKLLNGWNDAAATELFVAPLPPTDRERHRITLAHAALDYGACNIEHGAREIEHQPFGTQERTHFKLRCSKLPDALLDLTVLMDEANSRIAGFDLHRDAADDAVCAP